MATPDQTVTPFADGWQHLTARIAEDAHRTGRESPYPSDRPWHLTDQHPWHAHATDTIRAVLTAAAQQYEAEIRSTPRYMHPHQPLRWPHADFVRWLNTTAERIEAHPAQTEPGS